MSVLSAYKNNKEQLKLEALKRYFPGASIKQGTSSYTFWVNNTRYIVVEEKTERRTLAEQILYDNLHLFSPHVLAEKTSISKDIFFALAKFREKSIEPIYYIINGSCSWEYFVETVIEEHSFKGIFGAIEEINLKNGFIAYEVL